MTKEVTIKHPIYIPIEDKDTETMRYYEELGVPVRKFAPHGTYHYYAIVEGESEEQAANLNNAYGVMHRKETRSNQRHIVHNASYDGLLESGFDAPALDPDPSEIVAELTLVRELLEECEKLTEQKQRICKMIEAGMSEREMAKELGIAQTTLHDRKVKVLKELKEKLG